MEKVLNQQEIDAVVRAARGGGTASAGLPVTRWDYRQSGRLGREQLDSVSMLHEAFARSLTHSMGAYLRTGFQVAMVSAEHLTYREFLGGIPEVTYLASCKLAPFSARGLIQLDLAIAFPLIDVLLGGEGTGKPPTREITEIEEQILETVMRIICRELQTAWQALALEFQFEQRQQPGQVQQLLPAEERILCLSFEVIIKDCRGTMSLAVPAVISSALLRKLSIASPRFYTRLGSANSADQLRRLLLACAFRLELGMTVAAGSRQLADLTPGMVLAFNRRADASAELAARGRPIFQAAVVRRGNTRAAHIVAAVEDQMHGRRRL